MNYFDLHHHNSRCKNGIYNLNYPDLPTDSLFSAGIHPLTVSEKTDEKWKWLVKVSQHPNCAAIGECGLDARVSDDVLQKEIFGRQIELANALRKPLIIHCVRRFSELPHFKRKAKVPMVIHGFNKKQSVADELSKHDFYLSFGKSLLQNVNLQLLLKDFPLEKMFLETDSEEGSIDELYQMVSSLKGISVETLILQIEKNLKAILP